MINNYRTYIRIGFVVLIIICAGIFTYRYLVMGTLNIHTKEGGRISVYSSDIYAQKSAISSGVGNLSARLHKGKYIVKVSVPGGDTIAASRTVTVSPRKTSSYDLKITSPVSFEPVASFDSNSVSASSSVLKFVDRSVGKIAFVDNVNTVKYVGVTTPISEVNWANTDYGIARDKNNNFYIVDGSSITQFYLPFPVDNNPSITFSVSSNKRVFLSSNYSVYTGFAGGEFKKIYTSKVRTPIVSSAGNLAAVLEPASSEGAGPSETVRIIDSSGHIIHESHDKASSVVWSKNGEYLALLGNDSGGKIVTSSLASVGTLPGKADFGAWLGKSFFYAINNELWTFNVQTGAALKVAQKPLGNTIEEVVLSDDGRYVYITNRASGEQTIQIFRYDISGKPGVKTAYGLDYFFPSLISNSCYVNYVNFSAPTLQVLYSSGSPDDCIEAIGVELYDDGIDFHKVEIRYFQSID